MILEFPPEIMLRCFRFAPLGLLIATACSAAPQDASRAGAKPSTAVPKNSPLEPGIKNVPATTGRANLAPSAPPFNITPIGKFDAPFAMAFLPDGSLLVTEKAGKLKLRAPNGTVVTIAGAPPVAKGGQGGLLDVAIAPDFADDQDDLPELCGTGRRGQRACTDARDAGRSWQDADQHRGDLAFGHERPRRPVRRDHPVLA